MPRIIPACVVDDHCNVVPFYHASWRAKRMPLERLLYIHIDAHPDLCPPPLNTTQITNLTTLYDVLDDEGGISEFILPLIAAGHISEVVWLRPTWSEQISSGKYHFRYGDTASVHGRVDLQHEYYFDDNYACNTDELKSDACDVSLTVCTAGDAPTSPLTSSTPTPYVLDICLDYFVTFNPFLMELQQMCKTLAVPLDMSSLMLLLRYPLHRNMLVSLPLPQRYDMQRSFYEALEHLSDVSAFVSGYYNYAAFDIAHVDSIAIAELHHTLTAYLPSFVSYPQAIRDYILHTKHLLLLPHQPLEWSIVTENVHACMRYLASCSALQTPPQVISIARSDGDEYTPPELADDLLKEVQESIRSILLPIWQAQCLSESVVIDWHTLVGDNIYVQARRLFVKRKYESLIR